MPEDHTVNKPSQSLELPTGRLAAQFEFLELIDSGGMGVVYKARNVTINQIVAIKMIQMGSMDDRRMQRFKQEATALSSINHYNIVQVKDFGFTEHAQPYMVLEYIDGVTLPQFLKTQRPDLETLRLIFTQIADALGHAHERGVLHRDLKPSNIMIKLAGDGSPVIKVIDFGIAKFLTADSNSALTQTGEVLGSPAYMSPEQIGGSQQDVRTDIYSFGCVMFEALTGAPPFQADSPMDIIFQQLNADVPKVQTKTDQKLPQSFADIATKCLQKSPSQRFQSMAELGTALTEAQLVDKPQDYSPLIKKTMIYASVLLMLSISFCLIYVMHNNNQKAEETALASAKQNAANHEADREAVTYSSSNSFVQNYIKNHREQEVLEIKDTCTDDALIEFTQGDFATKTVKLSNSDVKGPGLAYLIRIPLHKLELQRSSLTDRGLLEIAKMHTLKSLALDATRISPAGLAYLSEVPLAKLSVRDLDTDDEGLTNICKIAPLEMLLLDGNPRITEKGYAHLPELKKLETLSLRDAVLTDKLIKTLLSMKTLAKLYLDQTNVNDEHLKLLATSKTLRELHLEHDENITAAGLKYIIAMPQFTAVDIRGIKWLKDSDLEMFRAVNHKFYAGLENTKITDAGMRILAQTNIDTVDIAGTGVTDAGLLSLLKAKKLKSLRLNIGGIITADGIRRFEQLRPDVEVSKEMLPTKLLSSSRNALTF